MKALLALALAAIVLVSLFSATFVSASLEISQTSAVTFAASTSLNLTTIWTLQIVDSEGRVGHFSSLALDSNGYPQISYYDESNMDLKYAKWTGTGWSIQTVDNAGMVGTHTSIALDTNGRPHISYSGGKLKYTKWTGSNWDIQTVDDNGTTGGHTSIALDANGYPHISYYAGAPNYNLKYAKWTGTSWDIQTVDSNNVGGWTSLALSTNGYPHISYFDWSNKDLKYAKWTGTGWSIQTVDSVGDVGRYSSLALDANGNPHISYYDAYPNLHLKYAKWTGVDWEIQTVDNKDGTGLYTSIALDPNGYPHISYYDTNEGDLRYAMWTGTRWSIKIVDSAGTVGGWTSLALDSVGNPRISYHDTTNGDLKYASGAKYIASSTSSYAPTLVKQWNYQFRRICYRMTFGPSPAVADLGYGDEKLEIVTGNDEYYPQPYVSGRWFAFDANGNVLWTLNTGNDESRSSVAIADIDNDGDLEIAGGTTSGHQVQVFDHLGRMVWRYDTWGFVHSSPAVADIRLDKPGLEVIAGSYDQRVYVLDARGGLVWKQVTGGMVISSPTIGDVDTDGALEVVVSTSDTEWYHWGGSWHTYRYSWAKNKIYVLNGSTGEVKWTYTFDNAITSSAALANLDTDAALEVIIGAGDGKIYSFDGATGTVEWTYTTDGPVYSSPAVGDVDGDGRLEIVIGSTDGKVYSLDEATGALKWSYATGDAVWSSPAIANRGNGGLGVYVGSDDGYLYLIDGRTGTLIDRFLASGPIRSSPIVADIDGDEKLEIMFIDWNKGGGNRDWFWCVEDTQSRVSRYAIEWGMFRHDERRTGLYPIGISPVTDTRAPTSSVDAITPYWRPTTPFIITATASDDLSGVAKVELFYHYSGDNANWGPWVSFGVDNASPWSWPFSAPSGDGYYEFYGVATDMAGNAEVRPSIVSTIALTSIEQLTYSGSDNGPRGGYGPSWSPDGSKIAFQSATYKFYNGSYGPYYNWNIWTIDADGTRATQLTFGDGSDWVPDWSPDGQKIAFMSRRNASDYNIWIINADGSGLTQLTKGSLWDRGPDWSPDGTKIVFWSDTNTTTFGNLYVINADGTGLTQLTNNSSDMQPAWSPDGSRIAFVSKRSGNYNIWVMNADGSGTPLQITTSPADYNPAWSPDGSKIAFSSIKSGHLNIWIKNSDGSGEAIQITDGPYDIHPDWSPDGNKIAFTSHRSGNYEIWIAHLPKTSVPASATCGVDTAPPTSSVNPISPYWRDSTTITLTATARDTLSGVTNVTLYYRHSADNVVFTPWTKIATDTAAPWEWTIDLTENTYYEFYSVARDVAGNVELAPQIADARCAILQPEPGPEPQPTVILATVRIKPEVIDLSSKGVFTAFITLPEGYSVADIDLSTVTCEGAPAKSGEITEQGEFAVKFRVQDLNVEPGTTQLVVRGALVDGTKFIGGDYIIGATNPSEGSQLQTPPTPPPEQPAFTFTIENLIEGSTGTGETAPAENTTSGGAATENQTTDNTLVENTATEGTAADSIPIPAENTMTETAATVENSTTYENTVPVENVMTTTENTTPENYPAPSDTTMTTDNSYSVAASASENVPPPTELTGPTENTPTSLMETATTSENTSLLVPSGSSEAALDNSPPGPENTATAENATSSTTPTPEGTVSSSETVVLENTTSAETTISPETTMSPAPAPSTGTMSPTSTTTTATTSLSSTTGGTSATSPTTSAGSTTTTSSGYTMFYEGSSGGSASGWSSIMTAPTLAAPGENEDENLESDNHETSAEHEEPQENTLASSSHSHGSYSSKIKANVKIEPGVVEIGGRGKLTASIELQRGHRAADIDLSTIAIRGARAKRGGVVGEKFVAEFDVDDLPGLMPGEVELTVTGELMNGTSFEGSDLVVGVMPELPEPKTEFVSSRNGMPLGTLLAMLSLLVTLFGGFIVGYIMREMRRQVRELTKDLERVKLAQNLMKRGG